MATQLDLQEQEQLDAFKAFWKQYGNLITWTLVLALGAYAGWNGWQYWQGQQGMKAGAMFEELDKAAAAGDVERTGRILGDLKAQYPGTTFAQHAALLAAQVQFDKGQADAAKASLSWVADTSRDEALKTIARLRLAALQAEAKQHDEALKTLAAATAPGFEALVADRKGDVLLLQGKKDEARAAYETAFKQMSDKIDYRRLVEAKLISLGGTQAAAPAASAAGPASAAAAVAPKASAAASGAGQ
jgi:predicted negative regulator of RcsB-dependent stress response